MIDLIIGADGIARVCFNDPDEKVNLLTVAAMARLEEILGRLETGARDASLRGVVLASGKSGVFLAGADVNAFVTVARAGDAAVAAAKARHGQSIFSRLAALPIPSVAAINGACLGGGLELALACTARLGGDSSKVAIGLPEVKLGLIPGWGGTQRLPRLIGLSRALDLILTGRSLTSKQAKKLGIVDAVVPVEGIEQAACAEALRLAAGGVPHRPKWPLADRTPGAGGLILFIARRKVIKQTGGHYPAPSCAVDALGYGLRHGLEKGLAHEASLVGRLLVGDVSKNLVGIFLASRSAGSSESAGTRQEPISRIGVLGAGTMGGGIAAAAAMSGLNVRFNDVNAEALARGMKQVMTFISDAARKGRIPRHEAAQRAALVGPTVDLSGFSRCELVIEAVVEDLQVKRDVLRRIEAITGPRTIFATNTSSLSVADIAANAARPGRVIGLHFFNPAEKMPLVEVVRLPATDPDAIAAAVGLARRMGKTPVVVADTPGFIVNRILMPYLAGAMELLSRGLGVVAIDQAMAAFGMPMGPFALLDRIGIDVAAKVSDVLKAAFPSRRMGPNGPDLLHAMMQAGLAGAKTGQGFYRYRSGGTRTAGTAPELARLVAATYRPSARLVMTADEIAATLVDAMVNEGALLLSENAVDRPEVIDLAMVFGAGFPPFRGGLLRHADIEGHETIARRLAARGVAPAARLTEKKRFHP